jgi:adenylate cyclase
MIDKADGTDAVAGPGIGWRMRLLEQLKRFKGPVIAIASVGAVLSGLVGYWNVYRTVAVATPASTAATTAPASAGDLSIVVMPFTNQTGDPQKAYVADGLTTSLTSFLSRWRDIYVVPATTVFTYKDKALTVQQAGKEFGVRFVLNGNILSSGDKLRISAHLTDTQSGKQVWTRTFDGEVGNLLTQDQMDERFGANIGQEMMAVVAREIETRQSSPTVADLMLRVNALGWNTFTREHLEKQETLLRQALALEPDNPRIMLGLAVTLTNLIGFEHITEESAKEKAWTEARDLVLKAKKTRPDSWMTCVVLYSYAINHGDPLGARVALETWMALEPRNLYTYVNMGDLERRTGDPKRALEMYTKANAEAIRNDPDHPFEVGIAGISIVYMVLGDYDAALKSAIKAAQMFPQKFTYSDLALAYTFNGEDAKAREAVANLLRLDPEMKISTHYDKPRKGDSDLYREFWEKKEVPAWRKVGLPE